MRSPRLLLSATAALVAAVVLGVALLTSHDTRATATAPPPTTAPAPGPVNAGATGAVANPASRNQLDQFTTAVQDFNYGEPGYPATRDKSQSKLWFHDGSWWAVMLNPYYSEVHVFELRDGSWHDTGTFVDGRPQSSADVIWTGETLYVGSRTSTGDLLLQRYRYGDNRTWVPLSPTPDRIAPNGGQSLTIAVDGLGRVWAAWSARGQVHVAASGTDGRGFGSPTALQGGEGAHEDDAVAITELPGQVGVLWSNQETGSFNWTSRADTDPVGSWQSTETVVQGANLADGHINMAVAPDGNLFAAVKTSLGDDGEPLDSPLIEVLHRDLDGAWSRTTAALVDNQMTRAQLVITQDGRDLVLIAASPQSGGALYYKIASTADVRFAPGKGTLLLAWEGASINDATTTRAPVDPAVPLVVLASDKDHGEYYHAELSLGDILSAG